MRIKEFKNSGEKLSSLGLGCMRLPKLTQGSEEIDFEQAQKIVDYAYEHGVNYFDTAYFYHGGQSEEFIGQALKKYPRDSYNLVTKLPIWKVHEEADIERIFNEQLERAKVDYFDFYLFHAVGKDNFDAYIKYNAFDFLQKKRAEGKIRHIGFSYHDTPEFLETVCDKYPWDFAQLQINYLDWEVQNAKRQYEVLTERNIPCIVMEPVKGGTLASLCDASDELFKTARPDKSIASWAIRFVASLPNVMVVLSGMSNLEQVIDNVDTFTNFEPLTTDDYKVIEKALDIYKKKDTVPCTGCRYCMDCPHGVDIPRMFTIYNEFAVSKKKDEFKLQYQQELGKAENCIGCGICMEHCPQSIDIPAKMEIIQNLVK